MFTSLWTTTPTSLRWHTPKSEVWVWAKITPHTQELISQTTEGLLINSEIKYLVNTSDVGVNSFTLHIITYLWGVPFVPLYHKYFDFRIFKQANYLNKWCKSFQTHLPWKWQNTGKCQKPFLFFFFLYYASPSFSCAGIQRWKSVSFHC